MKLVLHANNKIKSIFLINIAKVIQIIKSLIEKYDLKYNINSHPIHYQIFLIINFI